MTTDIFASDIAEDPRADDSLETTIKHDLPRIAYKLSKLRGYRLDHPEYDEIRREVQAIQDTYFAGGRDIDELHDNYNLKPEQTIKTLNQIDKVDVVLTLGRIPELIDDYQSSDRYQATKNAWRNDDQAKLRRLVPQIFRVETIDDDIDAVYHGIDPKPAGVDNEDWAFQTDDGGRPRGRHPPIPVHAYIDRIRQVQQDGIKPSEEWMGDNADEHIRAVFTAETPRHAYGIVQCRIPNRASQPIYKPRNDLASERYIYTPSVDDFTTEVASLDDIILTAQHDARRQTITEYRRETKKTLSDRTLKTAT